jgi:pimeloyl-ACP methyl ester carboxylesterase
MVRPRAFGALEQRVTTSPGETRQAVEAQVRRAFARVLTFGQDGASGLAATILPQIPATDRKALLERWTDGAVLDALRYYAAIVDSLGPAGFTVRFGDREPAPILVPTHVLYGSDDPILPRCVFDERTLGREVGRLEDLVPVGGGHFSLQSCPADVFRELDRILARRG